LAKFTSWVVMSATPSLIMINACQTTFPLAIISHVCTANIQRASEITLRWLGNILQIMEPSLKMSCLKRLFPRKSRLLPKLFNVPSLVLWSTQGLIQSASASSDSFVLLLALSGAFWQYHRSRGPWRIGTFRKSARARSRY
jgi:hypothetical protein